MTGTLREITGAGCPFVFVQGARLQIGTVRT